MCNKNEKDSSNRVRNLLVIEKVTENKLNESNIDKELFRNNMKNNICNKRKKKQRKRKRWKHQ